MGTKQRQLHIIKSPKLREEEDDAIPVPLAEVTQQQLVDVLVMKEEIRMIRERIRRKEVQIAALMLQGASVQYGGHTITLDGKKRLRIYPFRGAILRHAD